MNAKQRMRGEVFHALQSAKDRFVHPERYYEKPRRDTSYAPIGTLIRTPRAREGTQAEAEQMLTYLKRLQEKYGGEPLTPAQRLSARLEVLVAITEFKVELLKEIKKDAESLSAARDEAHVRALVEQLKSDAEEKKTP